MPALLSEITHTTKTGPIHLPIDGRAVEVKVQHLVKTFGKHEAVKDISFTIGKGEIFGLLGSNGTGKSTTINMICGYLEPTSGDTLIDGQSITREPRKVKRMIGVVPQEIALYNDLNSLENLEFFGEIYGLSSQERKERAQALLHFVGLYDRRKEPVKKFSGGTILYTTHYMEEAERLCSRIAIMDEGQIVASGTLEQLLAMRDQNREVQRPHGLQELFIQLTGKTLRD